MSADTKIGVEGNAEARLAALLDTRPGERGIHAFLKAHAFIVRGTFATAWNYAEAFSEVCLGKDLRVDFVVVCANSGCWTVHVVELKSPSAAWYTADGNESQTLKAVKRQLGERNTWAEENREYWRKTVADLVAADDPGAMCSSAEHHQSASTEIRDPKTVVWVRFHAVVGRASSLTAEERARRREDIRMQIWGAPEVLTYDRLLVAAKRFGGQ